MVLQLNQNTGGKRIQGLSQKEMNKLVNNENAEYLTKSDKKEMPNKKTNSQSTAENNEMLI